MTREEAIEVYHGLINTKIKEAFEFFAPELRESEDERIRKWLYDYIERVGRTWGKPGPFDYTQILAWLEKQKENIEKEYVFRPVAGTDITSAARQAIRRAMEGDHLVLAFNGWYIRVDKHATTEGLVEGYFTFIEEQKKQKKD